MGIAFPEPSAAAASVREAGVSGAGGGFPTYAKWERLPAVDAFLMNHQESEPNQFVDLWLASEHPDRYAAFFDSLLSRAADLVVVGTKHAYREPWMAPLEAATDATVYEPAALPLDPTAESGVVIAYTEDRYEYGMENVLLQSVADVLLGKDLPTDYGWLVQNTETVHNLYRAFETGEPVTHKLVHVDGYVDGERLDHRFLEVPIGTPADELLAAAGCTPDAIGGDTVLTEGGPGWCFEVDDPATYGVRKRTNCLLVLDRETAEANTYGDGRIDVRSVEGDDWKGGSLETAPSGRLTPDRVRVPLITNRTYDDVVSPSTPTVDPGTTVRAGEPIAGPTSDGFSPSHHAPIDGEVVAVGDDYVAIGTDGRSNH